MFLFMLSVLSLVIFLIFHGYFKSHAKTTAAKVCRIITFGIGFYLIILTIIIFSIHLPSRNDRLKSETVLRHNVLEGRLSGLDDIGELSEDELKFYRGTIKNVEEFNEKLKRKQGLYNSEWFNWFVEPCVIEVSLIDLDIHSCYQKYK